MENKVMKKMFLVVGSVFLLIISAANVSIERANAFSLPGNSNTEVDDPDTCSENCSETPLANNQKRVIKRCIRTGTRLTCEYGERIVPADAPTTEGFTAAACADAKYND